MTDMDYGSLSKEELLEVVSELEKKYDELLEESGKQVDTDEESLDVRSRFFAHISHEFRTPLTLIIGPLQQMLAQCSEPGQKKTLSLMIRNAQRLKDLINQLLELSKFESGRMKLQAARQNIIPLLKGIIESFSLLADQNEVMLTCCADKQEVILYCEPEKIEEVVCNLLINSLKVTPPGGRIQIMVRDDARDSIEISVSDTGAGIPESQLPFIFDRFHQLQQTFEHHKKGLGIGLALAKEYITLHHGTLSVHNKEDQGTEFVIRLPKGSAHLKPGEIIAPAEPAEPAESEGSLDDGAEDRDISKQYAFMLKLERDTAAPGETDETDETGGTKNTVVDTSGRQGDIVLVVEDSTDMRDYIKDVLEDQFQILEAENGREGIKIAKEVVPDIIVSDIIMPETDGYELCRSLKTDINTSHIPIILLTAKAAEEDIIEGLEAGADDYIHKPFNAKILLTRIKNLIDLRRKLQQKIQQRMTIQPDELSVSTLDQVFIRQLEDLVEKNLSDSLFGLDEMVEALDISRATLHRKVTALTGESPKRFIQSYRIKRAAQLLRKKYGNVTDVAFKVGFASSAYFTKCFREQLHHLPSSYQKE